MNSHPESNSAVRVQAGARTLSLVIYDSKGGSNHVSLAEHLNPARD
jgi:hypothetical protein